MRVLSLTLSATLGMLAVAPAFAEEPFVPERLTVEEKIKPGPNLFVLDSNWAGSSNISVLSADDLSTKGNLSVGLVGQMVLSSDQKTAYTASAYAKRIVYGETEAVLHEFDVDTLSIKREIVVSPKFAQVAPSFNSLQISADDRYVFVQNATPAASVSVVDLKAGKQIAEVPTPGCWGLYPALEGARFSSLCGDGTITSYSVNEDGSAAKPVKSKKIFDVDSDPLFLQAQRAGKELLFTSYHGNLYRVSDKAAEVKLVDKFSYTEGAEGWAPGGFQLMAYNKANNVLFVAMHPDAEDGSHKNPAEEVWALDLKAKKVLYRSPVEGPVSLFVSSGKAPVLFALNDEEGEVVRYEVDPEAKFAAKPTDKAESLGDFAVLLQLGE
ncbi:amine dehydrogenase large subunit [Stutzerimonas kirkiae]|uniref:Amine dehydrogenase n=1 Tax=Stutzerimonas kirkiae TaxID=2211392 RepID=A0A4Q9R3T0_9GAMM|nr:amine dehydrogenase large subunit [Stutzerimonas kirkiae]TBU93282.1 amine dehydrogenase [Stutzerimonas kirkiae]TBV01416.1 amine dehydrogenase [Stutzerimonas kirkiae]TBV06887.1 amine dehydrogenase [Stutzerimonas kirkiae]TBV10388.1 amine dehydrogenase [Stutzerimonas kirkiae]